MNSLLRLTSVVATVAAFSLTAPATQGAVIVLNTPGATALTTAHGSAAAGDTIILAAAGNYGPANITKAITIIALNGAGTFSPATRPCLNINVTAPQAVITLKGYTCDVAGAVQDGIRFAGGHRLVLEDVTLKNAGGNRCGLNFVVGNGVAGFNISRSVFFRNGLSGGGGICVDSLISGTINGVIEDVASQNGTFGVRAREGGSTGGVDILISNSNFSRNGTGLSSNGATSVLQVSDSTISGNGVGLSRPNSGQIVSLQGNALSNFTNGTFSATVVKR